MGISKRLQHDACKIQILIVSSVNFVAFVYIAVKITFDIGSLERAVIKLSIIHGFNIAVIKYLRLIIDCDSSLIRKINSFLSE